MRRALVAVLGLALVGTAELAAQQPAPAPDRPAEKPAEKPLPTPTHAFVGARVIDGLGGAPIPDAVILVGAGKIVAVGPAAAVPIPEGVEKVDLGGKLVIPGLIDARSRLFLPTMAREWGGADASARMADGLDLYDLRARQALAMGVTTVHIGPTGDGFTGAGCLVKLMGEGERTGTIADASATLCGVYVRHAGSTSLPGQFLAKGDAFRQVLEAAEAYKETWDKYAKDLKDFETKHRAWTTKKAAHEAWVLQKTAYDTWEKAHKAEAKSAEPPKPDAPKPDGAKKRAPRRKAPADEPKKDEPNKDEPKKDEPKKDEPKKDEPTAPVKPGAEPEKAGDEPKAPKEPQRDDKLEALREVLSGTRRMILRVERADDIESALALFEEFGVALTLDVATDAVKLADKITKGKHLVIVAPPAGPDTSDVGTLTRRAEHARELLAAGIPPAIASPGDNGLETRHLRFFACRAQAAGLPGIASVGAITSQAAKALGREARLGSIAKGLDADLVVLGGPFSALGTKVLAVYIDGALAYRRP